MAVGRRPPGCHELDHHRFTEKGSIVSNIDLSVLPKHAIDGNKRLRRMVPLITAAALSVSLIAAAAGPASAAVREPARTVPISLVSSSNGLPAVSLTSAVSYVRFSKGRFTLDTLNAEKAGVSSQALSIESALVASMNKLLDRGGATVNSTRDVVVDAAKAVPATAQDTTITVLPGITLTITSTGIQLSMTKQAVTEVETVAGFAEHVAALVGGILGIALVGVENGEIGAEIADVVAAAIGLGSDFLQLCTASDGSATFTIPWPWLWLSGDLPSCSGISL
jgi:hypothetical protein